MANTPDPASPTPTPSQPAQQGPSQPAAAAATPRPKRKRDDSPSAYEQAGDASLAKEPAAKKTKQPKVVQVGVKVAKQQNLKSLRQNFMNQDGGMSRYFNDQELQKGLQNFRGLDTLLQQMLPAEVESSLRLGNLHAFEKLYEKVTIPTGAEPPSTIAALALDELLKRPVIPGHRYDFVRSSKGAHLGGVPWKTMGKSGEGHMIYIGNLASGQGCITVQKGPEKGQRRVSAGAPGVHSLGPLHNLSNDHAMQVAELLMRCLNVLPSAPSLLRGKATMDVLRVLVELCLRTIQPDRMQDMPNIRPFSSEGIQYYALVPFPLTPN